jgi:hypothetical protein
VSEAKTLIVPSKLVRRRFCFAYLARNPLHSDSRICSFTHEMALANANHRLLEELLNGRRKRRICGTDLSNDICALLAIRLGSMIIGLSLPHAQNGGFKAMIS